MPKITFPSIQGGLMNKAFVYVNAASTDVGKTIANARGAQLSKPLFPDVSATDRAFASIKLRKNVSGPTP